MGFCGPQAPPFCIFGVFSADAVPYSPLENRKPQSNRPRQAHEARQPARALPAASRPKPGGKGSPLRYSAVGCLNQPSDPKEEGRAGARPRAAFVLYGNCPALVSRQAVAQTSTVGV